MASYIPSRPEARAVGVAGIAAASRKPVPSPTAPTPNAETSATAAANNALGISVGSPNYTLPDPCGPPVQPPGEPSSKSTCDASLDISDLASPKYYGVQCRNDNSGETIDTNGCWSSDAIQDICFQISGMYGSKYQDTGKWLWSTQTGNCTFGYWLPEGGAPPPSHERCEVDIYEPMITECGGRGDANVGSVNLRDIPSANASGIMSNGTAVNSDYPSYIMVAQSSYWGVNSEDSE